MSQLLLKSNEHIVYSSIYSSHIMSYFQFGISGSSNSQDSFPGPGSTAVAPGGPNMDGYGPPYSGYPPASQPQQGRLIVQ